MNSCLFCRDGSANTTRSTAITSDWSGRSVIYFAVLVAIGCWADSCAAGDDSFDVDRYQAMRKNAEARLSDNARKVDEETKAQIKELEGRLAEVKKWTKAQFELSERDVIDKPKAMSSLMKHWQTAHEQELYQLLQFPEKNGGAIESGRALNKLLEVVGAAAYQNSETRKIHPEHALPLYEATEFTRVEPALVDQITWQENTLGSNLVGQGNRGPLDLDWPAILKEERWETDRKGVDDARQQATTELNSSSGVKPETDSRLRSAVGTLNADFATYRANWIREEMHRENWGLEYRRICDGTQHIQKLVMAAYQLVELGDSRQLGREQFNGGNIEDLLAYFQRHNLRFAAAGPAHRSAYYKLFNMMVRYYLDEKEAINLERQLNSEISQLKAIDKDAVNMVLGKTMTAADRAAVEVEQLKFVRALIAD